MILTKSKIDEYSNIYRLSERVPFRTNAAKLRIIKRPPTIEQEVINTSTTRWFLFEQKTVVTRDVVVDNTIRKQKCVVTPEMQEMVNKLTLEIHKMNSKADVTVISGGNVSVPNMDKLVEGQEIVVVPRIVETYERPLLWGKDKCTAFINWRLLPEPNTAVAGLDKSSPEPTAPC